MKSAIKLLLVLNGLLLLSTITTQAQVDRTFWFVAPEVTSGHGDAPIVLRITTFEDPASVTISIPANPGFAPINVNIPANTQYTHQFANLNDIENRPAATVLNKGILLTSNQDVSAYYEVANGVNPDKFTLKGDNALGTEFFVPSQDAFRNWQLSPVDREHIDIVSTEDNNQVTITVTDIVVGHPANSTFTITLNRGQTYSLQADAWQSQRHLGGTFITSTKPIAVTISDDSITEASNGSTKPTAYDLVGDQLIPTSIIGNEYIAVHTLFGTGITNTVQKVFVLAVEDNTTIYVDGVAKVTLDRGEIHELNITNNAIYITSTHPIYAYQFASLKNELGSAIIPNIACTGSQKVAFTRTLNQRFYVQVLTQQKNINAFIMRDENNQVVNELAGATWTKVNGTDTGDPGDTWYSTVKEMNLSTGKPYSIENTNGLFHLSILDENSGSMSYGYFSAYSTIRIKGPNQECKGSVIELSTDEPMKSYLWYSDKDIWTPFSTEPVVQVTETGKYWVTAEVNFGGCFTTDTLEVVFNLPEFDLGNDTIVCPGETLTYTVEGFNNNETFLWTPDNITTNTFSFTPQPGTSTDISLTVTDELGCSSTETVNISGYDAVTIDWDLSGNEICAGDTIRNTTNMHRYQWAINGVENPVDTLSYIVASASGTYTLTAWNEHECTETYSRNITVNPLPVLSLSDLSVCPGLSGTLSPGSFTAYQWFDGSAGSSITLSQPEDTVWVQVTNAHGCSARDTAAFNWYNETVFSFGNDTSVCINEDISISIDNSFSNYEWNFSLNGTGTPVVVSNTSSYSINNADPNLHQGTYTITALDNNGCSIADNFNLAVMTVPDLTLGGDKVDICRGDTIRIETPDHSFIRYEWTKDSNPFSTDNYILVADAGTYALTAWMANGCHNQDQINVTVIEQPSFDLSDLTVCPEEEFTLAIENWSADVSGGPDKYKWQDNSNQATYTGDTTGIYTVTVWDKKGCFATRSGTVDWFVLPAITLSDAEFCENETYALTSPLTIPADIKGYQWSQDATSATGPANASWSVSNAGSYTLTVTDNNNCVSSESLILTHLPAPDFTLGNDREMCFGDTIKIEAQPQFVRYEWNGDTSDGQPNYILANSDLTYSLKVWSNNGCSNTDDVSVIVNPLPSVNLGDDLSVCSGVTTTLSVASYPEIYWSTGDKNTTSVEVNDGIFSVDVMDAKGCKGHDQKVITWLPLPKIEMGPDLHICPFEYPITIEAPAGFEAYQWHNGAVTQSIEANLLDTINIVKVRDTNGCWGWDSKVVKLFFPPEYAIGDDITACEPEEVILDAGTETAMSYNDVETVNPIQAYLWSDGSINQSLGVTQSGEYWVEVFDGCFSLRDTVNVTFHPAPVIVHLDTIYYAQITVFAEEGTQPYFYSMDGGSSQSESTFKKIANGTHTITVEDFNGCRADSTFALNSQYDIEVPNFFTPNGDGFNDTWEIGGLERLPESMISIYDRFGKLLVKYPASNPGWNGEYMNRPVPSDDYWYVIELKPVDKIIKGNVTIKR